MGEKYSPHTLSHLENILNIQTAITAIIRDVRVFQTLNSFRAD